jgi:RHS repeat-associated protein
VVSPTNDEGTNQLKLSWCRRSETKKGNMKTTRRCMWWLLAAVCLLAVLPSAQAFYDPGAQRWINRDPIGESGFAEIRVWHQKETRRGANQHRFVMNDPCDFSDPEGLTVWVCSRHSSWPILGRIVNHVYFYDDDPEHRPSQSCSQQNSAGRKGTVSADDVPPTDPSAHCTPIEGTGEPGQDNDRARAIMSCCENTINSGLYIPFVNDCHNHLNRCLSAGGNYCPIKHPRFGCPKTTPVFPPVPLRPRTGAP